MLLGTVYNEQLELNAGFADDPGTPAYEQMRSICHSKDTAMGRLNALLFLLDCRPNCMESQAKSKYRDEHNAPLPGAAGDLARSCDEQLLDAFLASKRIIDERDLLIERHSRESKREEPPEGAYGASTDDEDARLGDVKLPERENGPSGDVEEATSEGHMSDDDGAAPTGHDGSVDAPINGDNDDGPS